MAVPAKSWIGFKANQRKPLRMSSESLQITTDIILVDVIGFREELSLVGVRNAIGHIQKSLREDYPDIARIYFASESVSQARRRSDSSAAD